MGWFSEFDSSWSGAMNEKHTGGITKIDNEVNIRIITNWGEQRQSEYIKKKKSTTEINNEKQTTPDGREA